jgi:hypothetical protein
MSQGGDRFGPNPYASDDSGGQPKRGMSTGTKVLLIVGSVFGVLAVLCCGFGFYIYNRITKSVTDDPAKIAAIRQEIVTINIPAGFAPAHGMDLGIWRMKMKMAAYMRQAEVLMLMEIPGVASDEEMRKQMEEAFEKQGQKQDVKVQQRDVRKITIDGKEYPFEFSQGVQGENEQAMRQVIGVFPGRGGTAILMYMAPERDWDEEEVMTMLRSISSK